MHPQRTSRASRKDGRDTLCYVKSWTEGRARRTATTRTTPASRLWPFPGRGNGAHGWGRGGRTVLPVHNRKSTLWAKTGILCYWTNAAELMVPVFATGVTPLWWRAMPGAEFSPGPVSERSERHRTYEQTQNSALSCQKDSEHTNLISVSGLTAAVHWWISGFCNSGKTVKCVTPLYLT